MKNSTLLFLSLSIILFSACSSKRVFEPENVIDSWPNQESASNTIIDTTSNVALLENQKVITKEKKLDVTINESYRLIASSDGWIISSTISGKLNLRYIEDETMVEIIGRK